MAETRRGPSFMWRLYALTSPLLDVRRVFRNVPAFFRYLADLSEYQQMSRGEGLSMGDLRPVLGDNLPGHPFDKHYFHQDIWAFERIFKARPDHHVDVASSIPFVSLLSRVVKVNYVDLRPLDVNVPNLECTSGNLLSLPFEANSVRSISCLHVAEHVGLGRYGDKLDPEGTKKSCRELVRVLAPGGRLYFSLPIGRERVCFNAHRVHSTKTILSYFEPLKLVELSGIDDNADFVENVPIERMDSCEYGCGLFVFTKQ